MVLPPSTADHAAGSSPGWLSRIERVLALARGGVLALVNDARPARLRALVLALEDVVRPAGERLHTCLRATEVMDVPAGATALLRVDEADAGWLNERRPLFAERALRVVLWAEGDTAVVLRRQAPDFFDWISHVIDCPGDAVPGFAIAGLRRAPRYAGIAWRGGALDAALAAAFPGEPVTRVSATREHGALVDAAKNALGWLVWTDVAMPQDLVRIDRALSLARVEDGRDGRTIVEEPACETPGWWPASDACMPWWAATDALARHGVDEPALVAALLDLEPGAVDLAIDLAIGLADRLDDDARGMTLRALLCELRQADDPGAHIAAEAAKRGLVDRARVARLEALPPALRAFYDDAYASPRGKSMAGLDEIPRGEDPARMRREEVERSNRQGELLIRQGRYEEAELTLHQGLRVSKRGGGAADASHASLLRTLSTVWASRGEYRRAEAILRKALAIHEHTRDTAPGELARTLVELARVLARQRRTGEARDLARRARSIAGSLGSDHPMAVEIGALLTEL